MFTLSEWIAFRADTKSCPVWYIPESNEWDFRSQMREIYTLSWPEFSETPRRLPKISDNFQHCYGPNTCSKCGTETIRYVTHIYARRSFAPLQGTLRSNDATTMGTSLKKWICILSVYIAIFPTHLLCQMYANPPIVEFLGTISKYSKRNKILKKCTKKRGARAKLLFC